MPRKLNTTQQNALDRVVAANIDYKRVRESAYAEARREADRRISVQQQALDLAVRSAVDAGVPKKQVHEIGMSTSNPYAVYDSLTRTDPKMIGRTGPSPFTWEDRDAGLIAVAYPNFPTTSQAEDYPAMLSGLVRVDSTGTSFSVVRDDTERESEFGVIPGELTWEMNRPEGTPSRLVDLLKQWMEVNWR